MSILGIQLPSPLIKKRPFDGFGNEAVGGVADLGMDGENVEKVEVDSHGRQIFPSVAIK